MRDIWQDLRMAIRDLRTRPAFTAVALLSLMLGIGANTAIFSFIDNVLLRSLPVRSPHQLVSLKSSHADRHVSLSYPVFLEIQARQETFDGLFAAAGAELVRASLEGRTLMDVRAESVSGGYFTTLGIQAAAGRLFTLDEDLPQGGPQGPVAVMSHGFWERQFGRGISALGALITIEGVTYTIIGVAPHRFHGASVGHRPDLWLPMSQSVSESTRQWRTGTFFRSMARLKPEVSARQAEEAMTALYRHLLRQEVSSGGRTSVREGQSIDGYRIRLEPAANGFASLRTVYSKPLKILMALVVLVLLIACCNVANLFLARGASRRRETGIRLALGSSRWRLIRQMMVESFVLSLIGGVGGVLLAYGIGRFWVSLLEFGADPVLLDLTPDLRILVFTLTVSGGTALLFGVLPAFQSVRTGTGALLRSASHRQSQGRERRRFSRGLVVVQLALSMILLVSTGLLVRSLNQLRRADVGLSRQNVLLMDVGFDLPDNNEEERIRWAERLEESLDSLPGISSTSQAWLGLFSTSDMSSRLEIEDYQGGDEELSVRLNIVSSGYFETHGIPLLAGRGLTRGDNAQASKVAVVNRAFQQAYFRNRSPLGKWIRLGGDGDPVEVVGVYEDFKWNDLRQSPSPMFFLSLRQWGMPIRSLALRTPASSSSIAPIVRSLLHDLEAGVLVRDVKTLSEQLDRSITRERLLTRLSGAFSVLGVFLACVGIYGVVSYGVVQRTGEIGIRMALGAGRKRVFRQILNESLAMSGIGIALGLPASLGATRWLESFLFGFSPGDPVTIAVTAVFLAGVTVAAGFLPARRASRIDPMTALRHE